MDISELRDLIRHKYELIPLKKWGENSKQPAENNWRSSKPLTGQQAVSRLKSGANVGVRMRSTDLVIDVDPRNGGDESASVLQAELMIVFRDWPTVDTPSGGWHHYMRLPQGSPKLRHTMREYPGVEFKTLGRQVVAPGSKHPNGGTYHWAIDAPGLPAQMAPAHLVDMLSGTGDAEDDHSTAGAAEAEMTSEELKAHLGKLDPTDFRDHDDWFRLMTAAHEATRGAGMQEFIWWSISDPVYKNRGPEIRQRWKSLRSGRRGNAGAGTLRHILIEHGATDVAGDAKKDFGDVEDEDLPSAAEKSSVDSVIARLNRDYKCVDEGGRLRVFTRWRDDTMHREVWVKYAKRDFLEVCESILHLKKLQIPSGGDKIEVLPAGQAWMTRPWKGKQVYKGIVFAPEHHGDRTPDGKLNLWRGFAYSPKPGNWKLLDQLIFETIAQAREEWYDYIMGWMARAVQEPWTPGEVALVVKGPKGAGKGTLGRAFVQLFGQHGLQVTSPALLTGRFNAHLRDVAALFADEAFWAGDKAGESILKGLVTEPIIAYEAKGANAEAGRNCVHIIMASNLDWVVPAGLDRERRFSVFEVADEIRSRTFWKELNHQLKNGGLEGLLHDLLERDLTGFEVRDIPVTDALLQQKIRSMDLFETWLYEVVDREFEGFEKTDIVGGPVIFAEDLHASLIEYHRQAGVRPGHMSASVTMGKRLVKMLPGTKRVRASRPEERPDLSSQRPWAYLFPNPEAAKKLLAQKLGMNPWRDDV